MSIIGVSNACKNYFNIFEDFNRYPHLSTTDRNWVWLKVFSYFTIVIPLMFAAVYGLCYLHGRVTQAMYISTEDPTRPISVLPLSPQQIPQNSPSTTVTNIPSSPPGSISYPSVRTLSQPYPGDLPATTTFGAKKTKSTVNVPQEDILHVDLAGCRPGVVTIRAENMFRSGAQVIVNAANSHLGGGGGIDGQIHAQGGPGYVRVHRQLQMLHPQGYPSGYATMIPSGNLKQSYNIDSVIVVAGPLGPNVDPDKQKVLYYCYFNALVLAHTQGKTSIAFPAISTGIFLFSRPDAAAISLRAINDFMRQYPNTTLARISIHFLPTEVGYLNDYSVAAEGRCSATL